MTEQRGRLLEWVLNLLTLAFVGFVSVSMVSQHLTAERRKPSVRLIKLGEALPIGGVNWQESRRTLVFALSTGCRFCSDSAPFYRALLNSHVPKQWQAVAVLPQPVEMANAYIESVGVAIPAIRQVDLGSIGVSATPTLLLLDQQGRLQQQWIGRLSASEESDVASHLGIDNWHGSVPGPQEGSGLEVPSGGHSPLVTTAELLTLLGRGDRLDIVDVRERSQYAAGRIALARNIPADELSVRAPHELLSDAPILVYCQFSAACAASGIPSLCSSATEQLRRIGRTNVRVVRDPVALLAEAGVPISTTPGTGSRQSSAGSPEVRAQELTTGG